MTSCIVRDNGIGYCNDNGPNYCALQLYRLLYTTMLSINIHDNGIDYYNNNVIDNCNVNDIDYCNYNDIDFYNDNVTVLERNRHSLCSYEIPPVHEMTPSLSM